MADEMTQTEFVKVLGISRSTLGYWYKYKLIPEPRRRHNNRPVYTMADAKKIAEIRGLKVDDW